MRVRRAATRTVALAAIAVLGCTWAPLRLDGEPVAVLQTATEGCEPFGSTTARTTARIGPFRRNPDKVRAELENLARNEAGAMGGDAIRALSAPVGGEQRFSVLRCSGDLANR